MKADLVRREMDAAGAVEVLMPILWPAELMEATGRLDAFGEEQNLRIFFQQNKDIFISTQEYLKVAQIRDIEKAICHV